MEAESGFLFCAMLPDKEAPSCDVAKYVANSEPDKATEMSGQLILEKNLKENLNLK